MNISDLLDLGGKRALITGASKGIGRGLALMFAAHGADIVAVARNEQELVEVKHNVEHAGRTCQVICADLAEMSEVQRVARRKLTERFTF